MDIITKVAVPNHQRFNSQLSKMRYIRLLALRNRIMPQRKTIIIKHDTKGKNNNRKTKSNKNKMHRTLKNSTPRNTTFSLQTFGRNF